jgi:hypothetical protein
MDRDGVQKLIRFLPAGNRPVLLFLQAPAPVIYGFIPNT